MAGKIRGAINACLDFLLSALGGSRQKWNKEKSYPKKQKQE